MLAEPHGDAMRYRLLESTRAYAAEKLADAGERDLVAGCHLRYLRDRFAALFDQFERTARATERDATLQIELEDVRSALDAALVRADVTTGAELLTDIHVSWRAIGLEPEGIKRSEAYREALPAGEPRLRARLSNSLSALLSTSGQKVRALELAAEAVELARASGDPASLAGTLSRYAAAATFLHRFDDAERALTQADRALAQPEAIPLTSANLRINLLETRAFLNQFRGDLETAARMHEQFRKEQRAIGSTSGEQGAALNLAEVEHARGQTQRAATIVRETLPAARSGANKGQLATLLHNLAGYLAAMDDLPGALGAAREAIKTHVAHEPDHSHVAIAIEHLALVFALRDDWSRAAILEGYADAALQRHGFPREFTETTTHDRLTVLLREGLGSDELARLVTEGAALGPQAAIELALEEWEARQS